ncbi:hypothetical protein P153DRAFT_400859 [Dothidotthia symphoricarpi CBS 119687]|uniref:Uncharacterized protein n=1 Tax=Dothidotthia symphoricarpi CBS 119687 TaxID=1392245 RepID=A0A6A5ZZR8_9PLEO|nr:uncharacterized protein P153DRAFT_400859 [Dothidotthia symphoricarpi CBS 119687]KAF2124776.1 hypothetical protein P153DRAFT_400859 [Dothidotthia symphoricarpi CBS 119687]
MTTATQAVPGIDISAADDDMDVHSDNGFDFGDGDIELDLEPAPSAYHNDDDDVSIQDAATDGGPELQTYPADQDDFMADNDDLIEPDDIEYGDDEVVAMSDPVTTQAQTPPPVDEDLIDYSDDDEEQPLQDDQGTEYHEGTDVQDETPAVLQDSLEEDLHVPTPADDVRDGESNEYGAHQDTTEQDAVAVKSDHHESPNSHHEPQSKADDEEFAHQDSDDGGILLQEPELPGDEAEDNHSDYPGVAQDDVDVVESTTTHVPEENGSSELRPVTVNYGGNDLWLFKQYDADNSGDWLLEDLALAGSRISDLFQACRSALGDDVSNETEIGFRFDHLHNMELYEDNTACVAVSLERLVDLYHTLHAQDDDSEPESFYVSLQFRPRFATLLADVAKYAEQGSGFSGLSTAIAAGETHFTKLSSGASTEREFADWESEEQEENDVSEEQPTVTQPADDVVHQEQIDGEPEDQASVEAHNDVEVEHPVDDEQHLDHDDSADAENNTQEEQQEQQDVPDDDPASQNSTNTDFLPNEPIDASVGQEEVIEEQESDVANTRSESIPATELQTREEEDLIDYSDDEGLEDVAEAEPSPTKEQSPSSSTVQGDEPAVAEDDAFLAEPVRPDGYDDENDDGVALNINDQDDSASIHQEQDDNTYEQDEYPEYDQTYGQEETFQDFQEQGTEELSIQPEVEGNANQDSTGYEYQILDQQVNVDLDGGVEDYDQGIADPNTVADDFTGVEDFLDLDDSHDWTTNEDFIVTMAENAVPTLDGVTAHAGEDDGVVEQSAAVASSTADPVATSLTDSKNSSPQRQKRSIDEVGNEADDALDSIDPKRPRV